MVGSFVFVPASVFAADTDVSTSQTGMGSDAGDAWHRPYNYNSLLISQVPATTSETVAASGAGTASDTVHVNHANHVNKVRILLMRHGERPGDSTVPDLTEAGYARAKKLSTYIRETFGKPDYIIAAKLFRKNNRPQLTVQPLSDATGVPIDDSTEAIKNLELADRLMHDKKYDGKLVVVCWHHSQIPLLAKALHAPNNAYPNAWDLNIYNLIIEFTFAGSDVPAVKQVFEPF